MRAPRIEIVYSPEDLCYIARVPAFEGCVAVGATPAEAATMATRAANLWAEGAVLVGRNVNFEPDEHFQLDDAPIWPGSDIWLDRVEGWKLPPKLALEYVDQFQQVALLRLGLDFLFNQFTTLELRIIQSRLPIEEYHPTPPDLGGRLPPPESYQALCFAHWYSVSACNLARMMGFIAEQTGQSPEKATQYLARILPAVLAFRDKVGAHFAGSTKSSRDNQAERLVSTFPGVGVVRGRVRILPFIALRLPNKETGEKFSDSRSVPSWSLTETHLHLRARYWDAMPTVVETWPHVNCTDRNLGIAPKLPDDVIEQTDPTGGPD